MMGAVIPKTMATWFYVSLDPNLRNLHHVLYIYQSLSDTHCLDHTQVSPGNWWLSNHSLSISCRCWEVTSHQSWRVYLFTLLHKNDVCVCASSAFYQAFKISLFNFCALQTSLIFNSPTFCFHNVCFQGVLDIYTPNIDAMLWQAMCGHKLMAV